MTEPAHRVGLLVSVRSAAEAAAALAGGADLIDVKEPSRGSLGRADGAVIAAVVDIVAGRRPVSAAMGELRDRTAAFPGAELAYQKWGLSGCGESLRQYWDDFAEAIGQTERAALVAYADWERAEAPPPDEVYALACERRIGAFVLDTFVKDGSTLLDWLAVSSIARLCRQCRSAGVRVALAGSLGTDEIAALSGAAPDWFAVRGAACSRGQRKAEIDVERVRGLAAVVHTQR